MTEPKCIYTNLNKATVVEKYLNCVRRPKEDKNYSNNFFCTDSLSVNFPS